MDDVFIHESARIKESEYGRIKAFRNVVINCCILSDGCSVGDDTTLERSVLENNVLINRRSYINDSHIGKYTYAGINTTINWTKIGRFCSLARNVDIGGFDHDYHKITTMPAFRLEQMRNGGGKLAQLDSINDYCQIGNDVWIAAGAQVLHRVKVGDGAVIGAGAIVTHDVPPYAIVVGVPAKVIGFRCDKKHIKELLEIQWWNWNDKMLDEAMEMLIQKDISDEMLTWMREFARKQ